MGAVAASILAVLVIALLIYKYTRDGALNQPGSTLFESQEIPSDFFRVEKETAVAAIEVVEKKVFITRPSPRKISVSDIAYEPAADDSLSLVEQFRDSFKTKRRGAGSLLAKKADQAPIQTATEFLNSEEDYPGVEKHITSYPVDLNRTLTADKYIPAILINALQSDLPGKVIAQIEHNVYSSHGRNVLIPAGSKAIGYYNPLQKVGDERVVIIWKRILTPEGININTVNAEMADAMGRSGLTGEVDNRNFQRFGMAFLVSTINALAQASIPVTSASEQIALETYSRDISLVVGTVLEQQVDIKPRLRIPAGARILISPMVDIWFKKPVANVIELAEAKL